MVAGAASSLLVVFEAEALRRGRLGLGLVVIGHGEVCFITLGDGRRHEEEEEEEEEGGWQKV